MVFAKRIRSPRFAPLAAGVLLIGVLVISMVIVEVLQPTQNVAISSSSSTTIAHPSGRPLRILVVGDSMAATLAVGLQASAPHANVVVIDDGHPGCSATVTSDLWSYGVVVSPPHAPCSPDQETLLNSWRRDLQKFKPDVVLYLARSEVFNQRRDGGWHFLGEPAFNAYVATSLKKAVATLSSSGAHVILLEPPATQVAGTSGNLPEDNTERIRIDDKILNAVAASSKGKASVLSLGSLLTPHLIYTSSIHGVKVRCSDGVHFTKAGGQKVAGVIFAKSWKVGQAHQQAHPARLSIPPAFSKNAPEWYSKIALGCQ